MGNSVPIVMAIDECFAGELFVSLKSALSSKRANTIYEVYVLRSGKFSDAIEQRFSKLVDDSDSQLRIQFVDVNERFSNSPITLSYISAPTFYRLLIPDLLNDLERCIYMDTDTIICDDLSDLFQTALDGNLIGGVVDAQLTRTLRYPQKIGFPRSAIYINAGVLLMDLQRLRAVGFTRISEQLSSHPFELQDQDIINYVCCGQIARLPYRYNIAAIQGQHEARIIETYTTSEILEARNSPCIIHYMTDQKPWNSYAPKNHLFSMWWGVARGTPFFEELQSGYAPSVSIRLEQKLSAITNSSSYRTGLLLSRPLRIVRRFFKWRKQSRFVKKALHLHR